MLERIEAGRVTEARIMEMVFPGQANHYGTLLGGQALALTGDRALCTRGRVVLVAIDPSGKPTPVPALTPANGERMEVA